MIEEGDRVLLLGKKRMIVTVSKGMSRIGNGTADLSKLIGLEFGDEVELWGQRYSIYSASLHDIVETFSRGPQVILPKDSAIIVHMCDIKSGDTVLEAGVGSGWLSAALINSVIPDGRVISYDVSDRSIAIASENLGKAGMSLFSEIRKGDIRHEKIPETFDAAVLDMPAPWEALENVGQSLKAGGHLCVYVPTCNQVERTVLAMKKDFFDVSARELLERELSVKENATRPAYNGLMHTGYIIHGRRK